MKNFFSLIFLALLVFACRPGKKKEVDLVTDNKPAETSISTIDAYNRFIKSLDTTDIASVSAAAQKYVELFAKTDSIQADSGFVLFEGLYDKMGNYLNEQHLKDSSNYDAYVLGRDTGNATKSPKANAHVQKLKDNGFTLGTVEGSTYIKQDRNFLSKYFYPHISSVMKKYLTQVNKENEEGFIDDAGLLITPLQLSERVLWWENFLKTHPSFVYVEEIKQEQKGKTTFLLEGIDNTPLLDYNTKTLQTDYRKAFESVLKKHPQSATAALIKPYYEALKQKDTKTAKKLLQQYKKQGIIYDYSA
ncbi:MAG: hypothetical protein JWQ40_1341 [Segetibacter sp.]|nr:hypothetical protein [Segetibacter sp.]